MIALEDMPSKPTLLQELEAQRTARRLLSLVYFDVDGFKAVNDALGHAAGDGRLLEFVNTLEPIVQQKGVTYRCGGDEFCVLMPNHSADEAAGTAERMRRAIDALPLIEGFKNTLSIGVVCSEDFSYEKSESLLNCADQHMYHSKRMGGNQVTVFQGDTPKSVERRRRSARSDLRDIFPFESEIKIVYSELTLGPPVKAAIDAYFETEEEREARKTHFLVPTDMQYDPKLQFRGTHVACVCEVRGAAYLASSLAEAGLRARILAATSSPVKAQLHRQNFIAIGAKSNQMTDKLLTNRNNSFVAIVLTNLDDVRFRSKGGKWLTPKRNKEVEDYGLIISIHPEQYPDKTWIACAGLGEHGTSGAAHFLAFSWWKIAREIAKRGGRADRSSFACIVKTDVSPDADDNAVILNFALSEDQWEEYPVERRTDGREAD